MHVVSSTHFSAGSVVAQQPLTLAAPSWVQSYADPAGHPSGSSEKKN
jgi:hypothetical protein